MIGAIFFLIRFDKAISERFYGCNCVREKYSGRTPMEMAVCMSDLIRVLCRGQIVLAFCPLSQSLFPPANQRRSNTVTKHIGSATPHIQNLVNAQ